MPDVQEMIGKEVEVISNGMVYRGKLIEVSDTEVHLKSDLQYVSLPQSGVTEIRLVAGSNKQWMDTFAVEGSTNAPTFEVPQEEKKPLIP